MKYILTAVFAAIFIFMVGMTIQTSLEVSLSEAWPSYAANAWAMATLYDAYAGFLIFYAWVVYKERGVAARVAWFVLIMGLGNIATALYLLIELRRLRGGAGLEALLLRRTA